jgi:hypothetical protein
MKKTFITIGLVITTVIGWGQRNYREEYIAPKAPRVSTFADPDLEVDPLEDIKYGTMYLMKSSNAEYTALGCFVLGGILLSAELKENYPNPRHVVSSILFISGAAFSITSKIQYRKGIERLYLGANGITIKLY